MAMLMLQRDGNGCMQRSYRVQPRRRAPAVVLPLVSGRARSAADADRLPPICSNDADAREVFVPSKEFACIGQSPPHDHPRIYLDMGGAGQVTCPYCGTRYRRCGPECI